MPTEAIATKTILILEDNPIARQGLGAILQEADYCVHAFSNGREGLDYLQVGNRPDLILLDMLMPVVDGWKFLAALRRRSMDIPIVITTGTILTREWAASNECAGFLRKPFDLPELLAEIERCLS